MHRYVFWFLCDLLRLPEERELKLRAEFEKIKFAFVRVII
jgi:hypothetical protein